MGHIFAHPDILNNRPLTAHSGRHSHVAHARSIRIFLLRCTQPSDASDCLVNLPIECRDCQYYNHTEPRTDHAQVFTTFRGKQNLYEICVKTNGHTDSKHFYIILSCVRVVRFVSAASGRCLGYLKKKNEPRTKP